MYICYLFLYRRIKTREYNCLVLNYRIFSQEIPSDVNVQVGEASFSLHKVGNQFRHGLTIQVQSNDLLFLLAFNKPFSGPPLFFAACLPIELKLGIKMYIWKQ